LTPGVIGREIIVRTPKERLALPTLRCQVELVDFDTSRQQGAASVASF
jgi:hypothetical protein